MDAESVKLMAAALCMALGAVGAAIGESWIATKAMDGMARNPEMSDKLFTNMIVAMAITESNSIYALVVSLIILFVS